MGKNLEPRSHPAENPREIRLRSGSAAVAVIESRTPVTPGSYNGTIPIHHMILSPTLMS